MNLPANGVDLRADDSELVESTRTTRRAPARRATATSTSAARWPVSSRSLSQNDIIIKGNLLYHQYPSGTDVLGLIANNNVALYHPVNSSGVNQAGSLTDPTVDAAILALNHSFFVQNWTKGAALGNLTVNGVITQEFRGAVGTFQGTPPVITTGYNKKYTYDTRLKYLSPPYFLSPTQSAWQRISYAEIQPTATP